MIPSRTKDAPREQRPEKDPWDDEWERKDEDGKSKRAKKAKWK
jgi:hypothetical protein